ncbi:MAG: hypothetical protein O7G83_17045 [Proteobacteria bacterium]|nr:hypothetical protein [Pseudomonadota bacterium]
MAQSVAPPRQFRYVTPVIYPVFPACCGTLAVGIDLGVMLRNATAAPYDGDLVIDIDVHREGKLESTESLSVPVCAGMPDPQILRRDFAMESLGYAELRIHAESPIFRTLNVSIGYGLLSRPGHGTVNVLNDEKFAAPAVIRLIEEIGRFCVVHVACLSDPRRGIGNSFLCVNPYDKDIIARMFSASGRKLTHRVKAKSAAMVSLDPLLENGRAEAIMVTGNNRFPVWDVRHAHGDPFHIHNIDHLEIYRSALTHEWVGPVRFARAAVRRGLRELGLRIA